MALQQKGRYVLRRDPNLVRVLDGILADHQKKRVHPERLAELLVRLADRGYSWANEEFAKMMKCGDMVFKEICENGDEQVVSCDCGSSLCRYHFAVDFLDKFRDMMWVVRKAYSGFKDEMQAQVVTFTMPYDVVDRVSEDDLDWLRRTATEFVQDEFGGVMIASKDGRHVKRRRVVVGGVASVHVMHSYHPWQKGNAWRGWFPHVNVVVLDRQWDHLARWMDVQGVSHDGAFVHRRVTQEKAAFEGMRVRLATRWMVAVESKFGPSRFRAVGVGPKGGASTWSVNVEPVAAEAEVERTIAYNIRPSKFDAIMEAVEGAVPTDDELPWVARMVVKHPRRKDYAYFGWLHESVRNDYLGRVGVHVPALKERREILRKRLCIRCGGNIVKREGPFPRSSPSLQGIPYVGWRLVGSGYGAGSAGFG